MIEFQTKPEIALDQIKSAYAAGLPQGVVLMDAGYGNDTDLRTQVTALGLSYVAGIGANTAVWPPGTAPLAAAARIGPRTAAQAVAARRRAPTRSASRCSPTSCRPRSAQHHLARGQRGLAGLALRPPAGAAGASRHLASRAARRGVVADRVAARRARADQILAFHHAQRHRLRSPRRFGEIALADRARLSGTQAGARLWRLRRAWVAGFHHHATLCIAAYGFLIAERGALPPSGPPRPPLFSGSALPDDYRPRGAADPPRTACAELDRNHPPTSDRRPRQDPPEMPLLQCANPKNPQNSRLLTQ
jgi:hypothetical protein